MKKRANKNAIKRLWKVLVSHRDWLATVNSRDGKTYMTRTELFIVVAEPRDSEPSIDKAIVRARAFIKRNTRLYKLATIESVNLDGYLDE